MTIIRIIKGNTAQFKAHGLLEYYSVSLPKKSRQGVSLTLIYLYNLTKNLAAQSAHLNYAVLPKCSITDNAGKSIQAYFILIPGKKQYWQG